MVEIKNILENILNNYHLFVNCQMQLIYNLYFYIKHKDIYLKYIFIKLKRDCKFFFIRSIS